MKMDDGLHDKVVEIIKSEHIEYPSVKSFVDKAVKEKIIKNQEKKRKR